MEVIKKDGRREPFFISKVRKQVEFAVMGHKVSPLEFESLIQFPKKQTITTMEIQEIIKSTAVKQISIENEEWNYIAGRADMWHLYGRIFKNTKYDVLEWEKHIEYLVRNNYYRSDILEKLKKLSSSVKKKITKEIKKRNFDWQMVFAQVEMLKSKYLIKNKKGVIEYPVLADIANALILSKNEDEFFDIFHLIHNQYISLATPFKRNLRRPNGNVGSCFIGEGIDSLVSLMKCNTDMAMISKEGGGIGWYMGKVRPGDTYSYKIVKANQITKWLKIINDIAVAVNQAGTRPGSITVALDWWHMDIEAFLELKSELNGDLRDKAFDLFPQLVIDKWFLEKKEKKEDVYLVNQYEYKKAFGIDITELSGDELYETHKKIAELIENGKWKHYKKINAYKLWRKALETWIELGEFYITSKDNLNKSNYLKYDENGGIAKCANLCVESFSFTKPATSWVEKSDGENRETIETNGWYHACNLLSIVATNLVEASDEFLDKVCYYSTLILDRSIDEGEMPITEAKISSQQIRNIGIGIVGLADLMAYNHKNYDTDDGQAFAEQFIEKISYKTYKASVELAKEYGAYPLFKPENYDTILGYDPKELNKMSLNGFDWVSLQQDIKKYGIRNFYLMALAPNSSTGILMNAVASYLPVYNKEMYQTLADLNLPIIPKYIGKNYWGYKTKFQYNPVDIVKFTRKIQKWIDTGISMEMNINPELFPNIAPLSKEITDGFISGELKAVYYSITPGKSKNDGCLDCKN